MRLLGLDYDGKAMSMVFVDSNAGQLFDRQFINARLISPHK
jgi:hypothetical protein